MTEHESDADAHGKATGHVAPTTGLYLFFEVLAGRVEDDFTDLVFRGLGLFSGLLSRQFSEPLAGLPHHSRTFGAELQISC